MKLKAKKQRRYLNRDFDGFRKELLDYARTYFPDKIQDFSEASMGGLLLDFASYVGDNLSYYLDHQFHELNPLTAVEAKNIDHAWKLVRNEGRKFWAEYKPTMQWPHDIGYEALIYDDSGETLKGERFFS